MAQNETEIVYEGVHAKVESLLARKAFLRGVAVSVPVETAERLVADGVGFVRAADAKVETAVKTVEKEVAADVTKVETAVTGVPSKGTETPPNANSAPTPSTPTEVTS